LRLYTDMAKTQYQSKLPSMLSKLEDLLCPKE
jgi:hypothetical protein